MYIVLFVILAPVLSNAKKTTTAAPVPKLRKGHLSLDRYHQRTRFAIEDHENKKIVKSEHDRKGDSHSVEKPKGFGALDALSSMAALAEAATFAKIKDPESPTCTSTEDGTAQSSQSSQPPSEKECQSSDSDNESEGPV